MRKGCTSTGQHDFKYCRSSMEMSGSSSSNLLGLCVCKQPILEKRRMHLKHSRQLEAISRQRVNIQLTQKDLEGHESSPLNRRFLRKDFPERKQAE